MGRGPALALLLGSLACSPAGGKAPAAGDAGAQDDQDPAAGLPAGTVLTVAGLPVTAAEVDRVGAWVHLVRPNFTRPHLRRLALTNLVLPRLAWRARHPGAREEALRRARDAEPQAGDAAGWTPEGAAETGEAVGAWNDLGLVVWGTARELAPGTWSGPAEDVGRFVLVRLEEPLPDELPLRQELRVTIVSFPYPTEPPWDTNDVERAIDAARLEIVDPEWIDLVPETWKYRMR